MGRHWEIPDRLEGYLYIVFLCIWLLVVYPFGILLLLAYGGPFIWAWLVASPLLAVAVSLAKDRYRERVFVDDLLPVERMEKAEVSYVDEMVKVREREAERLRGKMTALDEYLEKVKRTKDERS